MPGLEKRAPGSSRCASSACLCRCPPSWHHRVLSKQVLVLSRWQDPRRLFHVCRLPSQEVSWHSPICALLSWQRGTRACVPLALCFWQVTAALLEDVLWGNCFDGE